MRITRWITKATETHNTQHLLLLHCYGGCTNASQCYVTLPVLANITFSSFCLDQQDSPLIAFALFCTLYLPPMLHPVHFVRTSAAPTYWPFFKEMYCTDNIYIYIYIYTGCPRRNVKYFGRVFLMLNYTDITQNTYIQS